MLSTAETEPTSWPLPPDVDGWTEGESSAGAERASKYYRARYYDPKIGRFISEDPIRFRGGINFYRYVKNNPVNLVDPSGLASCRPQCVATATAAGAAAGAMAAAPPAAGAGALASGGTLTIPAGGAGLVTGSLIGGAAGLITGLILCPDDNDDDDCAEEWEEAYEACRQMLQGPNPPRGITGGYTNIHDCARGLVSERCGGNPVN